MGEVQKVYVDVEGDEDRCERVLERMRSPGMRFPKASRKRGSNRIVVPIAADDHESAVTTLEGRLFHVDAADRSHLTVRRDITD
jgi:hypothetical protein